jgi:hypothetical protein
MLLVLHCLRQVRQTIQLCKNYNYIITFIAFTISKESRNLLSGIQFQTNGIYSRFDNFNSVNQLTLFKFFLQ